VAENITPTPSISSTATERMRRYRDRRRKKLRCVSVTIELRETEIDWLIRRRLLNPEMRNDLIAVRHALHEFLEQTLV
jgi:hypothetical protein